MLFLAIASTISLTPLASQQSVTIHYQNTYLSEAQWAGMPPEVATQVDPKTGETVAELLAADGKGIPSLSHTWITADRTTSFQWNGRPMAYRESETVSWLPRGAFIAPQAIWQAGANYDPPSTEAFLDAAVSAPLAEAAVIAQEIRVQGPAAGWAQAEAEHPILDYPLLGLIPRRIAEREIARRVEELASYFDGLTYGAQVVVEREELPGIAVSEDFFLAVRARRRQLESSIGYSMYEGVERVPLEATTGTTNCHSAALDFLAGGTSERGVVPFYELGTTRGRSVAQILAAVFTLHGPTYALPDAIRGHVPRDGARGSCSCHEVDRVCRIDLGKAGLHVAGDPCAKVCAPDGSGLPMLLANCATVTLDD